MTGVTVSRNYPSSLQIRTKIFHCISTKSKQQTTKQFNALELIINRMADGKFEQKRTIFHRKYAAQKSYKFLLTRATLLNSLSTSNSIVRERVING